MKNGYLSKKLRLLIVAFVMVVCIGIMPMMTVNAQNVGLNKTSVTLNVGKSTTLKVTGTKKKVKWSSSKNNVATVSSKGKVEAKSAGSAVITAKVGKKSYKCKVLVFKVDTGNSKLDKKVKSIISKNIKANMSTAEKIKAIHDYMVLNCEYDYKNYLRGTIPYVSYTPEGVILKKKAVCQGYAEAFELFMDALNIPCEVVIGTGNGGGHAWNIVKVDGKWYQIDVTWDDPVPDTKGYVRYNYFLIPDSKMDDDHKWDKKYYKKCKSSNKKFIKLFGKVSNSVDEAIIDAYESYKKDKNKIQIIIKKSVMDKYDGSIIFEMSRKYDLGIYSYSYRRTVYADHYILNYDLSSNYDKGIYNNIGGKGIATEETIVVER